MKFSWNYLGFLVENLQYPEIVSKMQNLRVLQLSSFGNVSLVFVRRLASSLPNLEEFHFTAMDMALSLKNLIFPFCQNSNLKTIVIFSKQIIYRCARGDIADIHRLREAFPKSSKLTIYMEKGVIESMKFRIPPNSNVILKALSELKREVHSFDI